MHPHSQYNTQVFLPVFAQLDLPSEDALGAEVEEKEENAVRLLDLLGKCLAQRSVFVVMACLLCVAYSVFNPPHT